MKTILSNHIWWIFIIIALVLLSGCKKESTEPPSEHSFTSDAYGNIVITNQHVLVVKNPLGSILITGQGSSNSCRWYLDKSVVTQSASDTAAMFSSIQLLTHTSNDTISVEVTSTTQSNPRSLVQLSIPYGIKCNIKQVSGDIEVDDLDSLLIIENASNVNVLRHNGSCQISSGVGNVSVESTLPIDGFCIIKVYKGDIILKVPIDASAQVYAKSDNGTVSQTGLTLTNVQQQSNLLNGKLGSGYGTIQLETTQGNIQIQGNGTKNSNKSLAIVEGTVLYSEGGGTVEDAYPSGFILWDCKWITTISDSMHTIPLSGKVDSTFLNKNVRVYGNFDTLFTYGWYPKKYLDIKVDTIIILH